MENQKETKDIMKNTFYDVNNDPVIVRTYAVENNGITTWETKISAYYRITSLMVSDYTNGWKDLYWSRYDNPEAALQKHKEIMTLAAPELINTEDEIKRTFSGNDINHKIQQKADNIPWYIKNDNKVWSKLHYTLYYWDDDDRRIEYPGLQELESVSLDGDGREIKIHTVFMQYAPEYDREGNYLADYPNKKNHYEVRIKANDEAHSWDINFIWAKEADKWHKLIMNALNNGYTLKEIHDFYKNNGENHKMVEQFLEENLQKRNSILRKEEPKVATRIEEMIASMQKNAAEMQVEPVRNTEEDRRIEEALKKENIRPETKKFIENMIASNAYANAQLQMEDMASVAKELNEKYPLQEGEPYFSFVSYEDDNEHPAIGSVKYFV